jgi:hypothetical protein
LSAGGCSSQRHDPTPVGMQLLCPCTLATAPGSLRGSTAPCSQPAAFPVLARSRSVPERCEGAGDAGTCHDGQPYFLILILNTKEHLNSTRVDVTRADSPPRPASGTSCPTACPTCPSSTSYTRLLSRSSTDASRRNARLSCRFQGDQGYRVHCAPPLVLSMYARFFRRCCRILWGKMSPLPWQETAQQVTSAEQCPGALTCCGGRLSQPSAAERYTELVTAPHLCE